MEFLAWLKYQKEKWKLQKQWRDEQRRLYALGDGVVGGALGGRGVASRGGALTGFLQQQNRTLIDYPWQIIQVIK